MLASTAVRGGLGLHIYNMPSEETLELNVG